MTKKISLLGATGSIGLQTVDIVKENPEHFSITAFSTGRNIEKTRELLRQFNPQAVSVLDKDDAVQLRSEFPGVNILFGQEGLVEIAANTESDIVVNSVLGSVGLAPTIEAIRAGKSIALANKETLVTAGHLVMKEAKENGVAILPVDSEHSAIFQSLNGEDSKSISKLILTASGGSFRDRTREELQNVTVEEALNHPNWSMGAKITIDSATMMNKGLEVIEAHYLFNIPYEQIDVLLHRESMIHSMVEYQDTSVIAQLGTPDMRVPIQYALTYPERLPRPNAKRLDLAEIGTLHFEKMDFKRFKALKLAYDAGSAGGTMPTVLNAANEAAVGLFLNGRITFLQIDDLIERAMDQHEKIDHPDLETVIAVDSFVRKNVREMVK